MGLVNKIEAGFKDRTGIHKPVECSYFIVHNKDGKKFLQLDTYGSEDRAIPGKTSQSIQFSPEAIKQLKKLFESEF